jgi:dihydrofolate reductase
MRKIILMMSVSLDGFIEGPERELDWHMVDAELHRHFNEQLSGMGAFLSGRVTHELMAGFWPTADLDPLEPWCWLTRTPLDVCLATGHRR